MVRLPNDLRLISLKYEGRCRSCARTLQAGDRAHWSRSSKKVWCVDCAHGNRVSAQTTSGNASGTSQQSARSARPARSNSPKPAVESTQTPWQQLCKYAQRCIEAEAAKSLVPYVKENHLWFSHPGEEQVVVGEGDSIQAPDKLSDKLTSRTLSIIYGWPTVVVTDRDHTPKIAPLFAVPIELECGLENQWTLHATTEPEFNLTITASGIFDPSVTEDINDLLGHGLPFGDADAFATLAGQTAKLLGLQILSPLNAGSLESKIERNQGVYNAAISVVAERFGYTGTLRKELQQLHGCKDWAVTAAACLISDGYAQKQVKDSLIAPLAAPLTCNHSQEETLQRFRKEPLTVVTGPPGTGKTQLVVNAVTNAWLDGDKVLVTSTNNGAVDVAVNRAVTDVSSSLLIRTGNREMRERVPDCITTASAQAKTHRGNQAQERAQLKRIATERNQLLKQLERLGELDANLLQEVEEREKLKKKLHETAQILWADANPPEIPMSSRAIERRARRLLRTWWFRGFRAQRLRRRLGCRDKAPLEQLAAWAQLDQRIAELVSQLKTGRAERLQLKDAVGDPSLSLPEVDRKWADASLHAARVDIAAHTASGTDRLAAFNTIPARGDQFKRAIGHSFNHLRGWACTALAAHSNFPLESGLFDLVIVDEASQCSLAAVLPLAYRAKRLAVVGDPYQLNPIVSLSDGLLKEIATQTGFDNNELRKRGIHHKDGSAYAAFEFAARPQTPILLNEHYRCHPHIARWFNKNFYNGDLTVLTDVSDTSHRDRAIHWYDVDGVAERHTDGSWINRAEAEETVKQLRGLSESGYRTVGVVTPFTAQARRINQLAKTQLGQDFLDGINCVIGTAHRLQGDERDAIVLSSVLSPEMNQTSVRWIEKERNLLNVAVSRARRALIVLGHPLMEELGSPTLASLRIYLRDDLARLEKDGSSSATFRLDSASELRLLDAMQLRDLEPYAKLYVEGYELDFALLEQGIKLNIEVDGDQHLDARGRQQRQDLTRDRVLAKLGWTVLRIPAWQCHEEIGSAIHEISKARDRLVDETSRSTF